MMRTIAVSAALAFTLFGFARAQTPSSTRQDLFEQVQPHIAERKPLTAEDLKEPPPGAASRYDDNYGKLKVILLDDKTHGSTRDGRSLWATTEELVYWPSNEHVPIIVPRGFVTDLASIPRPLWSWLPPDGPWAKAAVIHDFLYYTQGKGVLIYPRNQKTDWTCHDTTLQRPYTKEDADWILRDAQKDRKVDVFSRNAIWLGVHFGGGNGWDNSPGTKDYAKCKTPPKLPPGATP
jgi:hypothetical protein